LVAWTRPAKGYSPFPQQKLYSVTKVCADRTVAVVAHRTKTALALLPQVSLLRALAIRFIDAILFVGGFSMVHGILVSLPRATAAGTPNGAPPALLLPIPHNQALFFLNRR
jgi:hypothetical protein